LRGGRSPWFAATGQPVRRDVGENIKCDALIVGAGITGSLIAERLTRQGLNVVLIDRELPGAAAPPPARRCCCGRSTDRFPN
jgi:cation diffusion facilitator CzcD-associated flavoprotein CzcO